MGYILPKYSFLKHQFHCTAIWWLAGIPRMVLSVMNIQLTALKIYSITSYTDLSRNKHVLFVKESMQTNTEKNQINLSFLFKNHWHCPGIHLVHSVASSCLELTFQSPHRYQHLKQQQLHLDGSLLTHPIYLWEFQLFYSLTIPTLFILSCKCQM